jgi:hypothetical protein
MAELFFYRYLTTFINHNALIKHAKNLYNEITILNNFRSLFSTWYY